MSVDLPTYETPEGGVLTPQMLARYREAGVLILRNFTSRESCAALRQRMLEMIDEFDPGEVRTVFSPGNDSHQADDYFATSGDKIRFFLEHGAFDSEGNLRQPKADSLNKVGHAMHDLDPVHDEFCRTTGLAENTADLGFHDPLLVQSMYIYKQPHIGGEVVLHNDHAFIWSEPARTLGFWIALEPADLENGCLWAEPGGHRQAQRRRFRRKGV